MWRTNQQIRIDRTYATHVQTHQLYEIYIFFLLSMLNHHDRSVTYSTATTHLNSPRWRASQRTICGYAVVCLAKSNSTQYASANAYTETPGKTLLIISSSCETNVWSERSIDWIEPLMDCMRETSENEAGDDIAWMEKKFKNVESLYNEAY